MKVRLSNWASLGPFSDSIFDNRSLAIKQTKKMAKLQGRPMNLLKRLAQIFRIFFSFEYIKAELLREGIIFLIHLFARAILLMKKLKIEETKAT